ncbi:4-coumarate--CoA ligase 3-like [Limulus polyphemus]|uniref:4-coumarate--CoA ligase 3-like n=1 Tax=Limulus polyphemus TaxID=6850 RepID=A0ABM1T5Y0_LIMPO|nr:4-coumarate--CoA ligase 3-like [Limulus polyphemus]
MDINCLASEDKILRSPRAAVDIPNISVTEFFTMALEKYDEKLLVVSHDKSRFYTAQNVLLSSRRFASALIRRGLKLGDVFCICTANNIDYAAAALGAMNAGAIITLGKPMDKAEELRFRLEQTSSVYLLVEKKNLDKAKQATKNLPNFQEILVFEKSEDCPSFLKLVEEDDGSAFTGSPAIDPKETPLLLTFSSGTTGLPKAIVHTHYTFLSAVIIATHPTVWKFSQDDIVLGMYPFCHVGGFLFLFVDLSQGVTLSVVPSYESDLFLEVIEKHKVSVVLGAVSIVYRLLRDHKVHQYNLTSVKEILTGGAPLNQESNEQVVMNAFPFLRSLRQVYGLSEVLVVTCVEKGKTTPNSVGKLTSSTELKVCFCLYPC